VRFLFDDSGLCHHPLPLLLRRLAIHAGEILPERSGKGR
jgi:hypothetical protein